MGAVVPVRLQFVKRFALLVIPALLAANLAMASGTSVVLAGGNVGAITVRVLGGPLGNITTRPLTLSPAFDQATTDYVLRCHAGVNAVQVTLSAASAGKIAVGKDRGPSVAIKVNLVENQALVISGPSQGPSNDSSASRQTDSASRGNAQYWIRCLPHDFPLLRVRGPGTPWPGWYLTGNVTSASGSGTYAMVLDSKGTPVWYRKAAGPGAINITPLSNQTIGWNSFAGSVPGANPGGAFEVYNLVTGITRWLAAPVSPTDFHELLPMTQGGFIMLSSPIRLGVDMSSFGGSSSSAIDDCVIQEVDSQGGLVWEWRASDHISVTESSHPTPTVSGGLTVYDLFHCNSIDADPTTGNLLLSVRHTDSVYLIDRTTGRVIWRLGGVGPNRDNAQLLTISADPQGSFHAQHDARFQPNGDVSLYDNQSWDPGDAARAVEYQIDAASGIAALVWSYRAPDGKNSLATGSFRRLHREADNIVCWGFKLGAPLFTEVDSAGQLLLEVRFLSGEGAYRVVKVGLNALDANALRASAGLPQFVAAG